MPDLPRGTVTFAFTDVEGSTALLKQLGDSYGEVIGAHRRLVREAFAAHGGVEIDTQGDAFFFAFVRARDAVAAAADVQRAHAAHAWPHGANVRLRVGLHTGEPTLGEEGYLGLDVVRAARLCSACAGGHVLLSETTRALVGSALPTGVSVFPLGERHLKDLDEPERVYELEIEGLAPAGPAAPAPASPAPPAGRRSWEEDFERRVESFAERTAASVLGMIERSFAGLGREESPPPGAGGERSAADAGEAVDDLAARAEELAQRIDAALRRREGGAPRE